MRDNSLFHTKREYCLLKFVVAVGFCLLAGDAATIYKPIHVTSSLSDVLVLLG